MSASVHVCVCLGSIGSAGHACVRWARTPLVRAMRILRESVNRAGFPSSMVPACMLNAGHCIGSTRPTNDESVDLTLALHPIAPLQSNTGGPEAPGAGAQGLLHSVSDRPPRYRTAQVATTARTSQTVAAGAPAWSSSRHVGPALGSQVCGGALRVCVWMG